MRKISEILGKNIISLYEGKRIGIIENVAFDKKLKKLKSFIVYDEDSDDVDRLFVPSNSVKIEGENAVMIKNLEKVIEDTKNLYSKKNPVNANVYNLKGTLLGKITEVLIHDDTKDIHSLILNDGSEVLQNQIVSGDFKTIVIKGPDEELPVLTAPKKKKPVLKETKNEEPAAGINKETETEFFKTSNLITNEVVFNSTKVILNKGTASDLTYENNGKTEVILAGVTAPELNYENVTQVANNDNGDAEPLKEIYLNNNENEPIDKIPLNLRRCSAYFGFLIGRRVEHDVYNVKNEKIVKRNTIITNTTLDICKKWGKLIILARNSSR